MRVDGNRAFYVGLSFCVLAGWILYGPTLDAGFISDDFVADAMLDGTFASERHPLDLFTFSDGTPEDVRQLQRLGSVPWWASPELRLSFLRPLSSALVSVDRALFHDNLWAYHLHQMLWWTLLLVGAALIYRRLLPLPIALGATLLFALDEGNHYPVLWLANRGGIISLALCALSLHYHIRYRSDGDAAAAWYSRLCLAVSLLAGEWAFAMLTYFVAFELSLARDSWRQRFTALAAVIAPALAFLVVRGALGFGAHGSGIYVDPMDIGRFAPAVWERVPLFLGDLVWGIPAHWWDVGTPWRDRFLTAGWFSPSEWRALPDWRSWQWGLGVLAGALWAAVVAWTWRRCDPEDRRLLVWLSLSMGLSLVPVAASFPSSRLTLAAAIAFAPCVAWMASALLGLTFDHARGPATRALALLGLGYVVVVHVAMPGRTNFVGASNHFVGVAEWVVGAELPPDVPSRRVILLSSTEFTSTFFFAYVRHQRGLPTPLSFYPVSAARHPHVLERVSARELRLSVLGGSLLESDAERLFRSDDEPLQVGDVIDLPGMRVEVTRLRRGRPQQVLLRFETDVNDPSLVFLAATHRGMERIALPAYGEKKLLKRAAGPSWAGVDRGRYRRALGPVPDFVDFDPVPDFIHYRPDGSSDDEAEGGDIAQRSRPHGENSAERPYSLLDHPR